MWLIEGVNRSASCAANTIGSLKCNYIDVYIAWCATIQDICVPKPVIDALVTQTSQLRNVWRDYSCVGIKWFYKANVLIAHTSKGFSAMNPVVKVCNLACVSVSP